MTKMAKTTLQSRRHPPVAAPVRAVPGWRLSRAGLLAGVSLAAMASAAFVAAPARAGSPPVFSAQWFAARAQGSAATASGTSAAGGLNTAAAAQTQARQSIANLAKMAAAINAAQSFQASAAAIGAGTLAAGVPNGLVAGGLMPQQGAVAGGTAWIGANLPSQTTAGDRTTVMVTQTQPQALLNWESFNVGAKTTLAFDQSSKGGASASNWVALNKVPASVAPSQILGTITAPGKVFVINQSGILFGAGSQVNVNSLIASAADLPASITPGVSGGAASVAYSLYGAQSGSSFAASFLAAASNSTVEVQAGAQITTNPPASATSGGGYVMLFGGTARNAGSISTPQGQTVLASGTDFTLRQGYSTQGNQTATMRGSQVATSGIAGSTENTGIITATDGDVSLVGHSIRQSGVALATTSVNVRGTVHLLSDTADATATITIAPDSVTAVLPDDSTTTALNSQRSQLITQSASLDLLRLVAPSSSNPQVNNVGTLSDRLDLSRVEITTGGSVEFSRGSITLAQGGQVAVQAAGRVQADSTAALDVAGQLNVSLPMSANELAISVQPFEQRDAPVNRTSGGLNSTTVTIDQRDLVLVPASALYATDRYYTGGGLLEVSGYLNTTGHTIGEWAALGGTIAIAAHEVVAQTDASFNIAGGSVAYQAGTISATYLQGADGQIYNANTAPAGQRYTGIYKGVTIDHARWNTSDVFRNPLFAPASVYEAGYVVGRDAGTLKISAPTAIFEGSVSAGIVAGPYQATQRAATVTDGYNAPQNAVAQPGTLAFVKFDAGGVTGAWRSDVQISGNLPALADQLGINTAIPTERDHTVWLSAAALNAAGLGGLSIASTNSIQIATSITLAPGGTVSLVAPAVDFAAGVTARGGAVSAGNIITTTSGTTARSTLGILNEASVTLESGASIDTRGQWTNARLDPSNIAGEAFVNGGNVTFDSTGRLVLLPGSLIDASSGAALLASGKTLSGKGGSVTLIANDPQFANDKSHSKVQVDGTIRSDGVTGGGTLKLVAQNVIVAAQQPTLAFGTIWLGPSFFGMGFTTYDINGLAGLTVAAGTTIEAAAPVYQFAQLSSSVPTGSDPSAALQLWLPPVYIEDQLHATLTQRQGVSLVLRAAANAGSNTAMGGTLSVGSGASLSVDPGQSVRLEGYKRVTIDGTITAHGGTIAVVNMQQENYTLGRSPGLMQGNPVWLGDTSVLDASAQAYTSVDVRGRSFGVVPSGGSITIGAYGGSQGDGAGSVISTDAQVIIRPGAQVDASGTSAVLDPAAGTVGSIGTAVVGGGIATLVASSGGTIALSSYNGIFIDGTLRAVSGGAGAAGGTLAMTLEAPLYAANAPTLPTYAQRQPRHILVSQDTTSDLGSGALNPGDLTPADVRNQARISVAQIDAGGFANVSLFARDFIVFDGDVNLGVAGSVKFAQGTFGETRSDAHVSIAAPYVALSGFTTHSAENAVSGISLGGTNWLPNTLDTTANLAITADLIDISNELRFGALGKLDGGLNPFGHHKGLAIHVAYAGFQSIAINSTGDVRFNTGTLVTPGNLAFTAAQLYPTTQALAAVYAGVNYQQAHDPSANLYAAGGLLSVAWNGVAAQAPYSVAGSLVLAAPTVEQGGVIRAPEGNITLGAVIDGPSGAPITQNSFTTLVELQPGSVTSVSAAGQIIPFGGSADNQTYTYNGRTVGALTPGIAIDAQAVQSDSGATLDISGGGTLSGAVFQTGRGGSVDTLLQPLQNFTGTTLAKATLATRPVYAIVPGFSAGYAPVTPLDQNSKYAGSVPATGQQITLTESVDGLPPGTYTLLPAYYALLPGAFRVEMNTAVRNVAAGVADIPGGSYVVGGYSGTANTGVQSALAVPVTLTPASVVRSFSQYAETNYSQFEIGIAASTGAPRTAILADAKQLTLLYPSAISAPASGLPALSYHGVSSFAPADGGYGSTVQVQGKSGANSLPDFEITASGAASTANFVTLSAADLNALGAARLVLGGSASTASIGGAPTVTFSGRAGSVTLRSGATLSAPEVFLVAAATGGGSGGIALETGATIDTTGAGAASYDSTNGYYYNSFGSTVLAVSNGKLNFTPDTAAFQFFGAINIADGAALLTKGSLTFSTTQGVSLGAQAVYGAKYLNLDVASINIISTEVAALGSAVTLPSGLVLSQDTLKTLLTGNSLTRVPGVTELTLTATQSVNLFGAVSLSTDLPGAELQQLVLNTPAIYGWSDQLAGSGGPGAAASINIGRGTMVWNGIATTVPVGAQTQLGSQLPGGFADTGLETGTGSLSISAGKIVLGYPSGTQVQNQVSLGRLIQGFQSVTLTATQDIEGSARGSLAVYAIPSATYGQPGTGGDLTLNTPVLTGQAGALTRITAGGALTLTGSGGSSAGAAGLGAEIDLSAASVTLASTVALPSGRFNVSAQSGISLDAGATLALAGRTTGFFDQTHDGAGGSVSLATAAGDVTQAAGSTIDVSAGNAPAGSITIAALGGSVALNGTVLGSAASGRTQGSIDIRAHSLAGFAALNASLTAGGVSAYRAFEIGTGDLTIGNELVASTVSLTLDGGSLSIGGTINASGATPGTIDLSAQNGLTLLTGGLLDAHSTVLQTDSYGAAIDAKNTAQVTLTAIGGTLTIQAGSGIDVSSPDGVARGHIALNAPQEGGDDIAINVTGPVAIRGVFTAAGQPMGSLAVYGWHAAYAAPIDAATGLAVVTQAWLDGIDASDTQPFMAAASANAALQSRLQPLMDAAQGAFHLRPGIEIVSGDSSGDLVVSGDINLANYRYGANAEPGALVLRAAGNLTINGSVTDGFAAPADDPANPNPDNNGWLLFAGNEPFSADVVLPKVLPGTITLGAGTTINTGNAVSLNYDISIQVPQFDDFGNTIPGPVTLNQGVAIPTPVTLAAPADTSFSSYAIPASGWVATANIYDETGAIKFAKGAVIAGGTQLLPGWRVDAGSVLPFQINVPAGTIWPAGASLQIIASPSVTLAADQTLPGGALIPSQTVVVFTDGSSQQNLRDAATGSQGQIWGNAPMLAAGTQSWSLALVSGADTGAASRLAVQPQSALAGGGNMVLSDLHYTQPNQGYYGASPSFSVVRTGTGDLTLKAGGDITQYSLYGIYTAGTQTAVDSAFQQPLATGFDGTVFGAGNPYNAYVVNYQAYYPTGGGNVLVAAQGGVYGDIYGGGSSGNPASDWVGNWLWRQGTGTTAGVEAQSTAWWINFGTYVIPQTGAGPGYQAALVGFTGIGALGGGNLTVIAGGDAGVTVGRDATQRSQGLDLAVASTGRVTGVDVVGGVVTGGTLVQTGGGDLTVRIGGALNGLDEGVQNVGYDGLNGTFTNLRGNISVQAGQVGRVVYQYGTIDTVDTRPLNPSVAGIAIEQGGVIVVPGDTQVDITALRDVVLAGAGDAGRLPVQNLPGFTTVDSSGGTQTYTGGGITSFSLWTPRTSITINSLGGNATPTTQPLFSALSPSTFSNDMPTDTRFVYPAVLNVIADSGSIYYGSLAGDSGRALELAPAPAGQMQMLAQGSIYATGYSVDLSGANPNTNLSGGANAGNLANPFQPAFTGADGGSTIVTNTYFAAGSYYPLFAFAADTPTSNVHAGDTQPARFYAVSGDIVDFRTGEIINYSASTGVTPSTWYIAAKPAWILAGNDVVASGTRPSLDPSNPAVGSAVFANEQNQAATAFASAATSGNLLLNTSATDISVVSAGRDILSSYFYIAGPGLLEVDAGRNLNQLDHGMLKSIGPVFDISAQNRNGGAGISVLAGTGSAGIDTATFARLYFDPAHEENSNFPLISGENQGKVAQTYQPELLAWLARNFGYAGGADGALDYFLSLPQQQQDVFVRSIFFAELKASGREEGNPASRRYHTYVRGTEALYALLPGTPAPSPQADPNYATDSQAYASIAAGRRGLVRPVTFAATAALSAAASATPAYSGDVTMYSGTLTFASTGQSAVVDAGISTQFGGDIQVIVPGGQILLGVAGGVQPGSSTGLITFGSGNIAAFARNSIVLGQSRIFTTYGGNIQLWSATGDVNAGIGTKTSVVYQPPSITYDDLGNLTLAPTAPTNGAGIATLTSVPGVPAGDVDLVAPQGTIDAGEAGIRVSGNLTLAALTVANGNNLSVGGKTVGAPTIAVSNVGALQAASAATGAAQSSASNNADEARRKRQAAEASVILVEVLGFGE